MYRIRSVPWCVRNVCADIFHLGNRFDVLSFEHVNRDSNIAAHNLANHVRLFVVLLQSPRRAVLLGTTDVSFTFLF